MKLFTKEHVYEHDWDAVTAAFWVKYPNDLQPHVRSMETLNRELEVERKRFRTRRLLYLEYSIPRWATSLLGIPNDGFAIEECICDLPSRTLSLHSYNYTFKSVFRVDEYCMYTPHPTEPEHTLYTQKAYYSVFGLGSFAGRQVESAAVRSAADKAVKGLNAMQKIIANLEDWRCSEVSYREALEKAENIVEKYTEKAEIIVEKYIEKAEKTVGKYTEKAENIVEKCTAKVVEGLHEVERRRVGGGEEGRGAGWFGWPVVVGEEGASSRVWAEANRVKLFCGRQWTSFRRAAAGGGGEEPKEGKEANMEDKANSLNGLNKHILMGSIVDSRDKEQEPQSKTGGDR
eukprot:GHVS01010226.1.p1 GENE.GHVS01010226.1~~GHVS01010226.1.p1  ORF type:complete len:345 (+),score=71.95 GHVS01010226.1:304-1338(+)